MIHLKMTPLVIELELVGNHCECVDTGNTSGVPNSTSWKTLNHKSSVIFSRLIMNYKTPTFHTCSPVTMPIHFSSCATSVQTATYKDNSLSIARSFTRLKSVCVTMFHGDGSGSSNMVVNYFYNPMIGGYDKDAEVEFQLQRGSAVFPQYPIRSLAEAFYSLRKTLGIAHSGSLNVSKKSFMQNIFS